MKSSEMLLAISGDNQALNLVSRLLMKELFLRRKISRLEGELRKVMTKALDADRYQKALIAKIEEERDKISKLENELDGERAFNAIQRGGHAHVGIEHMGLSVRAQCGLESLGIKTVGDLVECSEQDLLRIKGFGRRCLKEVKVFLEANGLQLQGGRVFKEEDLKNAYSESTIDYIRKHAA